MTENTAIPNKAKRFRLPKKPPCSYCIFCDASESFEIDRKVRECASGVNDNKLIGKLASGDIIAIEAKYHTKYLVALHNKARKVKYNATSIDSINFHSVDKEELALAELLTFIDESIQLESPAVLML